MAVTASGLYVANWVNELKNALSAPLNLSLATYKIALYNNTDTPNFSTDVGYSSTNEVNGTGWAAGGVLLSAAAAGATSTAPTLTESPTGTAMYDMNDVSVATTTLTNVRCCKVYADPLTNKPYIVLVNFGQDYSTVAGTFGIQWNTLGVFTLDITP